MSYIATKGKFHVALDGVGLLLQGAPAAPGYKMSNAPVYGTRFASGDRDYNDLSQWWYLIQTDWSGGFKDTFPFVDDAKFFYSSNINARTKPGTIRLEKQISLVRDNDVGGNDEVLSIDTLSYGLSSETIYIANNGVKILSDGNLKFASGESNTQSVHSHRGYAWAIGAKIINTSSAGSGVSPTDQTANIDAVISGSVSEGGAAVSVGDTLYIFGVADNYTFFCVKTSVANPSSSSDYTLVFQTAFRNNLGGSVVGADIIGGQILFLIEGSPQWSLYYLDIASGVASLIREFDGCSQIGIYSKGCKYVKSFSGKLLITVITDSTTGTGSVWEYDGSLLSKKYDVDEVKKDFTSSSIEAVATLRGGCSVYKEYAYWGNLVYDGENFFNWIKDIDDSITNRMTPLGSDGLLLYTTDFTVSSGDDQTKIYSYNDLGTTYKDGANHEAFLVMSQHDKLQSIDKLLNTITIGFERLASGQSISIYYSMEPNPAPAISNWTLLGTASYSVDGGTVTSKVLPFAVGTIAKKVWIRVELASSSSGTPGLTDLTLEYLPFPDYKKQWTLNVNCGDEVKTLAGSLVETTGRELKSRLEKMWWTKSSLDFQDLDYATTLLDGNITDVAATTITVDSTADFPEQGKIRIDNEEILYTDKKPTQFLNCIRGARGTRASTHSDNAVVNNAYRVIVMAIQEQAPILLEDKNVEYVVSLSLREV